MQHAAAKAPRSDIEEVHWPSRSQPSASSSRSTDSASVIPRLLIKGRGRGRSTPLPTYLCDRRSLRGRVRSLARTRHVNEYLASDNLSFRKSRRQTPWRVHRMWSPRGNRSTTRRRTKRGPKRRIGCFLVSPTNRFNTFGPHGYVYVGVPLRLDVGEVVRRLGGVHRARDALLNAHSEWQPNVSVGVGQYAVGGVGGHQVLLCVVETLVGKIHFKKVSRLCNDFLEDGFRSRERGSSTVIRVIVPFAVDNGRQRTRPKARRRQSA